MSFWIGKRGQQEGFNKIVILILAVLVLAAVAFFLFKTPITNYIRNLGYSYNTTDREIKVNVDDPAFLSTCPQIVGKLLTQTGFQAIFVDYAKILFCVDKRCEQTRDSGLFLFGKTSDGDVGVDRINNLEIGQMKDRTITIFPQYLSESEEYLENKADLPALSDIRKLNEAYYLGGTGGNLICRKDIIK